MNEINSSSRKIALYRVLVIDEIAFQTNLLALNAAVEAARVGEQGRGFAVVASGSANAAGRKAQPAQQIKLLVGENVQKIERGADLVNKSGEKFNEILASITEVADMVSSISNATSEQSLGMDQITKSVHESACPVSTNPAGGAERRDMGPARARVGTDFAQSALKRMSAAKKFRRKGAAR